MPIWLGLLAALAFGIFGAGLVLWLGYPDDGSRGAVTLLIGLAVWLLWNFLADRYDNA